MGFLVGVIKSNKGKTCKRKENKHDSDYKEICDAAVSFGVVLLDEVKTSFAV